ncbi:MAG: hypothetical protein Q9196_005375 [Gyalolechia fulgens]
MSNLNILNIPSSPFNRSTFLNKEPSMQLNILRLLVLHMPNRSKPRQTIKVVIIAELLPIGLKIAQNKDEKFQRFSSGGSSKHSELLSKRSVPAAICAASLPGTCCVADLYHLSDFLSPPSAIFTSGIGSPEEDDDDSEDLAKLDIPDIPVITDGSFANLVDRPLPANFVVADALEPFDPPQPEKDGRCQSKYVTLDASSTFMGSIRETKHWEDFKSDPMFRFIHDSGSMVSLEEIDSLYRHRPANNEPDQTEVEEGEWTQHEVLPHEESWNVTDKLEHLLSAKQPMKAPPTVPRTTSWDNTPRRDHNTYSRAGRSPKEANGLRGVDGTHRPVRNFIPPPPARAESPTLSPERTPPMRSRTPSMYELNELHQQECGTRPGSSTLPGSTPLESMPTHSTDAQEHPSLDPSDPFEPPPPPAHLRKPRFYDGANEDRLSAGAPNGHVNGNGILESNDGNGNGRSHSNGHSASPTQVRFDAASRRKREYSQQAISDEDNTPKRRQVDDTKSKVKKRQPVVAAAYR